jgi:Yip1 domain
VEIMSETGVPAVARAAPAAAGLTQWQRVAYTFTAPSKTFEDIGRGNRSWWLPFLITLVTGTLLWVVIGQVVTWRGVFDNNQRDLPEFAKHLMENMTPAQKAKQEQVGPRGQEITWAVAPLGILLIDVCAAAVLLATINFGFGGNAKFGEIFAVVQYAGLVMWPIKFLLGAIALYAGALPDAFDPRNPAGTNLGYYLSRQDTPLTLYTLATNIDIVAIWCMIVTAIGVAVVAGTKRGAGYFAVFGWWAIMLVFSVGIAAVFS